MMTDGAPIECPVLTIRVIRPFPSAGSSSRSGGEQSRRDSRQRSFLPALFVFLAACAVGVSANVTEARAQGLVRVVQSDLAAFRIADITGEAGKTVLLNLSIPSGAAGQRGLVMFRGMPSDFRLSSGFKSGDTWLVSLPQTGDLHLIVPDGFDGSFNIEVTLVLGNGKQRISRVASVNIGSIPAASLQAGQTPTNSLTSVIPKKIRQPTISPAKEQALLTRAVRFLKAGDISAARLAYEHLANNGSAIGALSLAKTYDPTVLSEIDIFGIKPDINEAKRWYERAVELGESSAEKHLQQLQAANR